MISFEESLKDIPGLSKYEETKLPAWLKEQLLHYADKGITEDAELVERFMHGGWLGHWGVAEIDGEEVAVLEHLGDGPEDVADVVEFAWWAECGYVVVEPSVTYRGGCTIYLTEHFCVTPLRRVAAVEAANAC
jgi:hypothetical protein